MYEIAREINISAPKEKVWQVLADVDNWQNWSPIINGSQGSAASGAKLQITMAGKEGKDGPKYSPVVSEFDAPNRFRWRATMMAGFIFTNDKLFELTDSGSGTKLVHKELFSGLMLKLFASKLDKGVGPLLDSMNQALKERVESLA